MLEQIRTNGGLSVKHQENWNLMGFHGCLPSCTHDLPKKKHGDVLQRF